MQDRRDLGIDSSRLKLTVKVERQCRCRHQYLDWIGFKRERWIRGSQGGVANAIVKTLRQGSCIFLRTSF